MLRVAEMPGLLSVRVLQGEWELGTWYWSLQHLFDSSEASSLVYNRVVDILAACGGVFLPSTADTDVFLSCVQDSCFSSTLFFALVLLLQQEESQHS